MLHEMLANATDLDAWADRLHARVVLPKLLLRLVYSTAGEVERIEFPSEESTQLGGWDGRLNITAGNEFITEGQSGWEFGTSREVKGKADSDYEKRKSDPLGLNPAETTFVFVTLRRWGGKEKWVEGRRQEGFWRDVRALDADDIAAWLERAPGVHLWLSTLIGKHPEAALDLTSFWKDWSEATDPPISPDLVISGRRDEVERIVAWLGDDASPLAIQADSRKEALAFFAASVALLSPKERESCLARCVVVSDVTAWRQVITAVRRLVLIPMFEDRDVAGRAVGEGHHVLIPLGREDHATPAAVKLPRLLRRQAKNALENMGLRGERAEELAALARRSMTALRRKLAAAPEVQTPSWTRPSEAKALTPVILVGTWDDTSAGDREVVASLARKSYGEVDGVLARWSNESDPPARRVGDLWLLVSKEDAWDLLAKYLTREELENFENVVVEVLGAADETFDLPAGKRYLAGILGKALPYSGWLRGGLADTVALMAARGESLAHAGGASGQERANRIVWKLLHKANADWRIWASISDHLPLLAEAAPEIFLEAVEAGLSGDRPILLNLFSEDENSFLGGSPHTGLLWALERLAWHQDYLGHSSLLLSKLTRLDPGGRMGNRPGSSLREIFLFWLPQSSASLESRLRVLDLIRRREPHVAWNLLCSLLPGTHGGSDLTSRPKWRDWQSEARGRNPEEEVGSAEAEIVSRLLQDAGVDGGRWRDLIVRVDELSREQHGVVVERLLNTEPTQFGTEDRVVVWDSLRELISRHREFPEADWVLPDDLIGSLERAYRLFEPEDLLSKKAWLFSSNPSPPEAQSHDWHERHDTVESARLDAVRALMAEGGLPLILETAGRVEQPGDLGFAAGKSDLLDELENDLLVDKLSSETKHENAFARGFIVGRIQTRGDQWVAAKVKDIFPRWTEEQRADFFSCMPFEGRTWDLVEAAGVETERHYWARAIRYRFPAADECERAAVKLIHYGRPDVALHHIAFRTTAANALAASSAVTVEAFEALLRGQVDDRIDWRSLAHDMARLLDALEARGELEESRIASLEWGFLPLLKRYRRPKVLHRELARNPDFFSEVVALVYDVEGEGQRAPHSEDDIARARYGRELLEDWRRVPGISEDGSIGAEELRRWVRRARESLGVKGRSRVGDYLIGEALARAPGDPEGTWPHEVVRDLIEDLQSERLESGIETGVYNSRGIVMKSPLEGGSREHELVERYSSYSRRVSDRWPRTARLLKRIADRYIKDARREDVSAELTEDFWH